jgi:hypothetical protein
MKQKLLFFSLIISGFLYTQETMHIDFDEFNPGIVFNSWNSSASFAKVANPDVSTENSSAFVGQFTSGDDNGIGIGVIDPTTVFTTPFNLTALSYFKMKVWSSEAISVTLHIENSPDYGNYIERTEVVNSEQLNQWVELTFDFSGENNIFMNNIVIKVGGDFTEQGDNYYFDDILGPPLYDSAAYDFSPSNNATEVSVGANMIITTNDVFTAAQGANISDINQVVSLREGDINGDEIPFTASINGSNNEIIIDPINSLDFTTSYWYGVIDDQIFHANGASVTGVNATFTTKEPVEGDINVMLFDFDTVNQDLDFVSWGGTGFNKVSNPDATGINTSANVGQYTHAGNDSGLENDLVNGATPLDAPDFSETPFIKVKVWVERPVDVMVRIQNYPDYGQGFDQTISVTETNQWVQLIYNFGSVTATNYDRAQIYFDRNQTGGTEAGDTYYFDDYEKSNVAPQAELTLTPEEGSNDISLASGMSVVSNLAFENLDGTTITEISSIVELRENNANGTIVPSIISISEDKTQIDIAPSSLLSPNTTYWYGVLENTIQFENGETVTGATASFTTTTESIEMVVYEDFDDISLSTVSETMGDPPGSYVLSLDPDDASNGVQQWDKGDTWWGWERIHMEMINPFDMGQHDLFSVRVYSPVQTEMMLKLADARDDGDQNGFIEVRQDIVLTNQWQTLYFDMSDIADGVSFSHLFIFIGPGDPSITGTFYIDNIEGPGLQNTAGIDELNSFNFSMYPNPSSDIVFFKNLNRTTTVKIFDINMRLVKSESINSNQILVKDLNSGVYFVEIDGHVKKLIKR